VCPQNIGACLRTAFFAIEIGDTHEFVISFVRTGS
jgi:hypothetical protein